MKRKEIIEEILEASHRLLEENCVDRVIAKSNAVAWHCEEIDIGDVELEDGIRNAQFYFLLCGDQLDDKMYSGTFMKGRAAAIVDEEKMRFEDVEVLWVG